MHGGSVHAHSEGAGKGSEFIVRLPAAAAPAPAVAVKAGSGSRTPPTKELERVLVVDDNADSAHGTAKILCRQGYEVRVAYDGPSAVETAREYGPKFVLLDIGLPGMDGYELAQRLRGEEALRDVKRIALCG